MSRFSFSRPSIITLSAMLGFLLGLGLLFVASEIMVLLPLGLQDSMVRIPPAFGTDLNFLLGYFACFAAAEGILGFAAARKQKRGAEDKPHLHQPPSSVSRHSFTLIELLIVIAVIAVLATVVILVINPAELLRQSRDANRVSDMATINQALTLYSEDVGTGMGSSSVVYVSVPDPTATSSLGTNCSGLGLVASSLPAGWTYHCAASSTYRSVNGTGWIPVDFLKVSSGAPIGILPVDPTNTTSSGLYYAYVVNGDPWELTADVESAKYGAGGSHDVVSKDGGQYPDLYEVGSDLSLDPVDYDPSLVENLKFDEGSGTVAYDSSGHGNNGVIHLNASLTSPAWVTSGCTEGSCLSFGGTGGYVLVASSTSLITTGPFTKMLWFSKMTGSSTADLLAGNQGCNYLSGIEFYLDYGNYKPQIVFRTGDGHCLYAAIDTSISDESALTYDTDHALHFIAVRRDASGNLSIFYDGQDQIDHAESNIPNVNVPDYIGSWGWSPHNGLIDDVRIYNRALSASEIQAIYNAEK